MREAPIEAVDASSSSDAERAPQEDRRRHARYVLSLAITMEGDNNFYTGLSENISEAGVFIATHHVLPIGTPVVLSFTLPFASEPISVAGTVKWIREPRATANAQSVFGSDRESASVRPGIGVQFNDVDQAANDAIRSFMTRRSPEFYD